MSTNRKMESLSTANILLLVLQGVLIVLGGVVGWNARRQVKRVDDLADAHADLQRQVDRDCVTKPELESHRVQLADVVRLTVEAAVAPLRADISFVRQALSK